MGEEQKVVEGQGVKLIPAFGYAISFKEYLQRTLENPYARKIIDEPKVYNNGNTMRDVS